MRKNILLIAILFITTIGVGQEISNELPILSPQTPTTNALGKFGEVQVNESTGLISPSIPLFEYDAGKMSLPITLSYSGNGVKVNQDPTWVGVNWNLNPSGVITRIVKDLPDELTPVSNRKYYSQEQLDSFNGVREIGAQETYNLTTQWYNEMSSLRRGNVDSEHDVFNYNFLDYSGSFILDEENVAHVIKYNKEVKIIFQFLSNNKSEFIIKTSNGDSYFFGGTLASESSRTWVNNGSGSTVNIPYTQNSFYLHRVSFLNGGSINFEYENYDINCDYVKIGIQESAQFSLYGEYIPCNRTSKDLYSDVENIVRLKKITNSFNSSTVEFLTSLTGECNRLYKLNNILLKNGVSLLKKINLNYITNTSTENVAERKFFLEKVDFYDSSLNKVYDYELEYNSPELFPSKLSFAQDDLGFYNGKNENTSLLATKNWSLSNNCLFGLADRDANFESAIIGALKKIEYPSGGKINFEYELPKKGIEYVDEEFFMPPLFENDPTRANQSSPFIYSNTMSYNVYCNNPNGYYYPIGGDASFTVSSPKDIKISIQSIINGNYSHDVRLKFIVHNLTNGQDELSIFTIKAGEYFEKEFIFTNVFHIVTNGEYVFKYFLEIHHSDSPNSANSTKFIRTNPKLYLPTSLKDVFYPGLRIKNVLIEAENGTVNKTRYYYNTLNHLNEETFSFQPKYVQDTFKFYNHGEMALEHFHQIFVLSANSLKNVFNEDSSNFTYKNVTISYGGENFENGGKELSFKKCSNSISKLYNIHPNAWDWNSHYIYFDISINGINPYRVFSLFENINYSDVVDVDNNDSFENSVLEKEVFFDNQLRPLKKVNYNYEPSLSYTGNNIKVSELLVGLPVEANNISRMCYILYKNKCYNYRLMNNEIKEYFGQELDREITSTTNYTYTEDKVSLPSSIHSTNSNGDDLIKKFYYPIDGIFNPSITNNNQSILINLQFNKYNIAEVIKSESYVGNKLLETKEKLFNVFVSNLLLPSSIHIRKSDSTLEERVNFLDYDSFGYPTLIKMSNGMKTQYIYNSRKQILLEIKNADSIIVYDDSTSPATPCYYQNMYPNAMVTKYNYDPITYQLINVVDPKCYSTYYEYDSFGRLSAVKDAAGNKLSENEYHYKD